MPYENTTDQDEVSILEVVGEMAKDLGLDRSVWTKEDLERRLETDKTMTQLEEAYVKQSITIMKWLAEEKTKEE